jgi:hypothetical protein
MTEDEFEQEILVLHNQLQRLDTKAQGLQQQINFNLNSFVND